MKTGVALVTGASSGIGEATAARLAGAGYEVYGTSRRGAQAGQRAFPMLPLDVTSDDSVAAVVAELIRLEGRIDLLVNNAGFGVAPAGTEESSMAQARAIFDTSFFGIVRMTRAVVPHMRRQGSGRIINIGSVLGLLPAPYMALYAATTHAIEGYSESLDHERVAAIETGIGPIEVAVYNLGAQIGDRALKETSLKAFETGWRLGTLGLFRLASAVCPLMEARGGGTLLVTSSTAAMRGNGGQHSHAAAMGGRRMLCQTLNAEFASKGIHVVHIVIDAASMTASCFPPRSRRRTSTSRNSTAPPGRTSSICAPSPTAHGGITDMADNPQLEPRT